MKLCLFCTHCYFSTGEPDWSNVTPGEAAAIACTKSHFPWKQLIYMEGPDEFRQTILTAKSCPDYKQEYES